MPAVLIPQLEALFPNAKLIQAFGLTETTGGVCATLPEETTNFPLSTGQALSGTEIRVVTDDGSDVSVNIQGEIIARGPQIMKGYLNKPDQTAQALRNGWLYTGDLGYVDEDGRVYVNGRKKDLIIRGGQNINPLEIEELIRKFPGVLDCAVVAKKHEVYQEVPVAFIVFSARQTDPPIEDMMLYCEQNLARYKVPTAFIRLDELPRTASGKVRKFELQRNIE